MENARSIPSTESRLRAVEKRLIEAAEERRAKAVAA
jgi:hypothetical protein